MNWWIVKQLRAMVIQDLRDYVTDGYFEGEVEKFKLNEVFENRNHFSRELRWGYLAGTLGRTLFFDSTAIMTARQVSASEVLMNLGLLAAAEAAHGLTIQLSQKADTLGISDGNAGAVGEQLVHEVIPTLSYNVEGALERYLRYLTPHEANPFLPLLTSASLDSTVKGFNTVQHLSPSTITIDTLYLSKDNIPKIFLRGSGVPDSNNIEYYSCFISYSHNDEAFAKRLSDDLKAHGVDCWIDSHDLKIGDKMRPTIYESIRKRDKLLLILSESSLQSNWVEHEVEHALELEMTANKNVLFPVRLDDCVMNSTTGWAVNVRQRHIRDFSQWQNHDAYILSFKCLLKDLKVKSQA